MKLEAFNDVLASINKNPKRAFHLLLGNGFSIGYDSSIFSYNALHDFINKLDDKDLSMILGVIETRNFEVIMKQLDNFSAKNSSPLVMIENSRRALMSPSNPNAKENIVSSSKGSPSGTMS